MLRQIWQYFGGIKCEEIDTGGNVFTVARDGTESATHGGSWDWDGDPSWYRFWLKLIPEPDQGINAWGTFGSKPYGNTWGDGKGKTLGQTGVTPGDARTVKNLFRGDRPWKMAGTKAEWLICVLGQDEAHAPDGTWRYWTQDGVPTRYSGWRYWRL